MSARKYCRVAGRGLRPVMADHRNKIRRATQQERKMAAVFTADYEGLYSIHRKAVGAVCDSTQQNQEPHTEVNQQEQMDGKDKLLWRHSALARPSRVRVMRGMLPLLRPAVLNKRAMESSMNGCTAGGCVRNTIKLKGEDPPAYQLYRDPNTGSLCSERARRCASSAVCSPGSPRRRRERQPWRAGERTVFFVIL